MPRIIHYSDTLALPPSASGMRIGLFGGSFNPPHEGHKLVTEQVLKRLGLDAVWWLVSPGNPLKDHADLAPLDQRIAASRALLREVPCVQVTGVEAAHGFRYSYDTLEYLTDTLSDRHFVWIMGADSLLSFHRWERWRDIANLIPMCIYVRPGSSRRAPSSPAATALARFRLDQSDAKCLPLCDPPAWIYLNGMMSALSSTALRTTRQNPDTK